MTSATTPGHDSATIGGRLASTLSYFLSYSMTLYLGLALILVTIANQAYGSPRVNQVPIELGPNAVNLLGQFSLAKGNLTEVYNNQCLDWMRARVLFANGLPYEKLDSKGLAIAAFDYFKNSPEGKGAGNLWSTGLYPFKSSQMLTVPYLFAQLRDFGINVQSMGELRDYLSHPGKSPNHADEIKQFFERAGNEPVRNELFNRQSGDSRLIQLACSQYDLARSDECVTATKMILNEVNLKPSNGTHWGGNRMYPHLWLKIFTEKQYRDGIRLMSLVLLERMSGNTDETSSVFSDFYSSFLRAGMDHDQATLATFETLAVLSNGAQNIIPRLGGTPAARERQTTVALSIISVGISYLDFAKFENSQPLYSLPHGKILSTCLNTKWYHFWGAAYLSHFLVRKGIGPNPAIYATYNAQKGYQTNRRVGDSPEKDKLARILSLSVGNPTHQVIRIDLTLAAAGAFFGAQGHRPTFKLSVDQGLETLLKNAGASDKSAVDAIISLITNDRVQGYYRWNRIFAPNSVIDLFKSQIK